MCNKGKKDQTAFPLPTSFVPRTLCQAVCSAREFVSFASLSVTWSWHLCVLLLLLLSLPLSLMPLARSCPICIPSLSILCSPLRTLPSPTGIERAYQLLGQTITWCNIDFFHCRFSISHFIHSFCFSSFIFFFAFAFAVRLSVCPVRNCFRLPALSAGHFGSFLATVHSARLIVIAIFAIYGTFCSSIYRRRLSLPPSPALALVCLFYWQLPGRLYLGLPQWTTEQWRSGTFD